MRDKVLIQKYKNKRPKTKRNMLKVRTREQGSEAQRNLPRRISSVKKRDQKNLVSLVRNKEQRTGIETWFPILMLSSKNNKQTFSKEEEKTRKQKTNTNEKTTKQTRF